MGYPDSHLHTDYYADADENADKNADTNADRDSDINGNWDTCAVPQGGLS